MGKSITFREEDDYNAPLKALAGGKKCSNGVKIRYNTRRRALKALNIAKAQFLKGKFSSVSQYIYQCRYCNGWHITTDKPRNQ